MSTDYEPGTVAKVKPYIGVADEIGLLSPSGAWVTAHGEFVNVADVRPLVVLDPHEDSERLQDLYSVAVRNGHSGLSMHAALIEFAKPPRITEPGLWGVVEAARAFLDGKGIRTKWVRVVTGVSDEQWFSDEAGYATWDLLINPTLIREGLS